MTGLLMVGGALVGMGITRIVAAFVGDLMVGDAELHMRDTTKMQRTRHLNLVG